MAKNQLDKEAADFLGVKVLTPTEENAVIGGTVVPPESGHDHDHDHDPIIIIVA